MRKTTPERVAVIKLADKLANPMSLAIELSADGFISYALWAGHMTSGMGLGLTYLTTKSNVLPLTTLKRETRAQFVTRVAASLADNANMSIVAVIMPSDVSFADVKGNP